MFVQERHQVIKKIIRKYRRLSFTQLQKLVDVSPATLRRDLVDLEKSGEILRVHGGVLDPSYVRSEVSFDERVLRHGKAKKRIASQAVALIPPESSVFVDAGSTCLEAGKMLLSRKDIRIITHSVALTALSLHGQAEFLCIGGDLRRVSGALVGGNALGALSMIRADFALMGTTGLDMEGCSTTELSEAEIKKTILARCRRNILLSDSTKWNQPSVIQFAKWDTLHDWITDKSPSSTVRKMLKKLGVTVRY